MQCNGTTFCMTPDNKELDQLFHKFMEGTCTPEETRLLWQWFFLLDTRSQYMIQNQERETAVHEEMRSIIMAQVAPVPKKLTIWSHRMAVAASLLIVIITTAIITFLHLSNKNELTTFIQNDSSQVRSFYLPDSSHIVLNRASSLSWKEDFNTKERRVILGGEGYFEVYPDKRRPFIVESNGIETKALGTAFTIEAYEQEGEIRVALLHGKVEIKGTNNAFDPALLQAGQMLRYNYQKKEIQVEQISISNPLAWTTGGMTFNGIPLHEALERLSRRYHITINYNPDQLKGKMVSGSFNVTTWEKLLPNILFLHDLKYNIQDSTITIQ